MMSSTLRVGLIGFGSWARNAYVPVLAELPSVQVTAVAARSSASREAAQQTLGGDVTTYADFRTLIDEADADAVMIALPGALHAQAVEAAIRAGKHVFFEPPLALTRSETEPLLDTIERHEAAVQVDFELRYLPVMDAVTDRIRNGAIGEVHMARVSLWADWGRGEAMARHAEEGAAFVLGPWYVDLLDAVFADMPEEASVIGSPPAHAGMLDHGWMTFRYRGGQVGCFEMNLLTPEGQQVTLDVFGSNGEIHADLISGDLRWGSGDACQRASAPPSLPKCGFVGMRECVRDFVGAIIEGRSPRTTPDVIRRVHEAMLLWSEAEQRAAATPASPPSHGKDCRAQDT